jgi:arginase family enzyme
MLEEMKISPNNSFYGINIDDYVNILDCGDIIMEPYCLENIHSHLEYTVSSLLIQNNSKIFLIGGTNDSTKCTFSSLAKCQLAKSEEEKEKIGLIHIDSSFDIEKIANKEEKSTSIFRDIHKKAGKSSKSEIEIVHFGGSGVRCSSEDEEFIKKRNGSLYWINRHIRTTDTSSRVTESEEGIEEMKMKDKWRETETQAGMLFSQIVEKLSKEEKQIIVSFDVASMQVN